MNRTEAIEEIIGQHPDAAIIFSNGLNSREASYIADRPGNFYLLHGMGEALSVGFGIKSARPELEVVVIDGDGSAVMGLSECTLLPVEGLYYYILINNVYETTGSQSIPPLNIDISGVRKIAITEGTAGAPNPPDTILIKNSFVEWIKRQ